RLTPMQNDGTSAKKIAEVCKSVVQSDERIRPPARPWLLRKNAWKHELKALSLSYSDRDKQIRFGS
ncbi:MAG TPA: hypothetical protein VEW28_08080, partial [Candidatus Kapabacteria bacterium]|nr:hypothetical protein [Candidatus Kapabacteria bacterium]